ncbi:MAG: hypothetical protein ABI158_00795 [Edaphobacter sp.]
MSSGEPVAFGGVWDIWKQPDDGWLQSFAITATVPIRADGHRSQQNAGYF